jgi:hypothetical protein
MQTYRFYFLDQNDRINADESFEADAPADAIDRALAMLCARPHHRAVEVWQGARRLYPSIVQHTGGSPEGSDARQHRS